MDEKYVCGFDIGASKITIIIADSEDEIVFRKRVPIDESEDRFEKFEDGWAYLRIVDQLIDLLKKSPQSVEDIAAIGIGTAGPLDDGVIKNSTNIKPVHLPERSKESPLYIPLTKPLSEEFKVPVGIENDCQAGVLGEVYFGEGAEVEDKRKLFLVYVTLSTGFGGGVWDGGKLISGKEGNAGEVGHFPVKEDGLKCGCGNYGCAESYCSGTGIVKNARMKLINEDLIFEKGYGLAIKELATNAAYSSGSKIRSDWELLKYIDASLVAKARKKGDKLAEEVFQEAAHFGGIAFGSIANAYDPAVISVGGALALENPDLLDLIDMEMKKHLNVTPPRLHLTKLGYRAVEYGAISVAKQLLRE